MVNLYVAILMAIKKKAQLVYLHIQIIVILQMNYFRIPICYIRKSYFLGRNKYIIYLSSLNNFNCNKNQIAKSIQND